MTPTAIGVDVGTTRIKAVLVDLTGAELAIYEAATPWDLATGSTEIDVRDVADVAIAVAAQAAQHGLDLGARPVALGVTGMAETGALLGVDGTPIAPGYAWHHALGDPDRLYRALGRDRVIRTTGRDATISPSVVTLDALRCRGLSLRGGTRWLTMPEYVAFRLCGVQCAEVSEASRTGMLELSTRQWWREVLDFLDADEALLPGTPIIGGTPLGAVTDDLPASLRGLGVSVAGHDHPTAGIGVGAHHEGVLAISLGTAEAQLRVTGQGLTADQITRIVELGGTVDWHPLGDRMSVLLALPSGVTLGRLAAIVGAETVEQRLSLSASAMDTVVQSAWRPTLEHMAFDSFAVTGITDGLDRAGLWRTAVEQIVAHSVQVTAAVEAEIRPRERAVIFGGWIHDPLVRREWARALGSRTTFATVDEPGARGAALLAARAVGESFDLPPPVGTAPVELKGGAPP